VHPWSVGIENPDNPNIELVLPIIIKKKRLCTSFAFIIAGADSDTVNIAPVIFRLGMHGRITVYL
jgi:hypothetical protein